MAFPSAPTSQQAEPVVQPCGDRLGRQGAGSRRGELNGQRYAVNPSTDLQHRIAPGIVHLEMRVALASVDDNNVCTLDGCDSSTGVFHTVINVDDNNVCTLDGCDSSTGVFHTVVNVDDNNVCTLDGCDSSTGVFHTVENIDDNNACTLDGCNPSTGIFHTPLNIDDDNACTTDFCNSISGLISHVAVNTDDNNGCTTDACDPLTGAISHTDVVILLNVSVDPILCYGSSTCLFVSASGGTPPYSGIGMLCGYSAGNFDLVVTDANGCEAAVSGTIDQPSKLIVNINYTQSNCSGNSGTAAAFPSGGTPPYSYLWLPGGQTTQTVTGLSAGNNSLTVTDANNCNLTTNFVITINNPPLGVISGPGGVCAKQSGQVFCIAPSNPYATSYAWTLPMGASVQGASNGSCITLKFSSKFKGGFICAKAVTTCGTSANVCLNVLLITTKPVTPGLITGPSSLCPNATATYSIVAIPNATTYTWSFSGNLQILSGQGTTSIVAKALSNWNGGSVKVKAVNCKDHSGTKTLNVAKSSVCKLSDQSISTKTLFTGNKFSVYPNPTSGKFKIFFEAKSKSKYTLKVIDLLGNLIKSDFITASEGLNTKDFDLNFVSKGMYFITLENEDLSIQSLRIVVD